MARRNWEFVLNLPETEGYESQSKYATELSDALLNDYGGEITPNLRLSSLYFGHLCYLIKAEGLKIITNDAIRDAIHYSNPRSHEERLLHSSELESWLIRGGFIKLQTEYCISDQYEQFKRIFCAPVILEFEEVLNQLDGRPSVSLEAIKTIIRTDLSNYSIKYSKSQELSFDDEDITTYVSLFRKKLHENGWVRGESDVPLSEIWMDPKVIHEDLASSDSPIEEETLNKLITDMLCEFTTEVDPKAAIRIDSLIEKIKSKLQSNHGWKQIWTPEDQGSIVWIGDEGEYTSLIKKLDNKLKICFDEVEDWETLDPEIFIARKSFLENNTARLKSDLSYTDEEIKREIGDLRGKYEYITEMERIEQVVQNSDKNTHESKISSNNSEYDIKKRRFWELRNDVG